MINVWVVPWPEADARGPRARRGPQAMIFADHSEKKKRGGRKVGRIVSPSRTPVVARGPVRAGQGKSRAITDGDGAEKVAGRGYLLGVEPRLEGIAALGRRARRARAWPPPTRVPLEPDPRYRRGQKWWTRVDRVLDLEAGFVDLQESE